MACLFGVVGGVVSASLPSFSSSLYDSLKRIEKKKICHQPQCSGLGSAPTTVCKPHPCRCRPTVLPSRAPPPAWKAGFGRGPPPGSARAGRRVCHGTEVKAGSAAAEEGKAPSHPMGACRKAQGEGRAKRPPENNPAVLTDLPCPPPPRLLHPEPRCEQRRGPLFLQVRHARQLQPLQR